MTRPPFAKATICALQINAAFFAERARFWYLFGAYDIARVMQNDAALFARAARSFLTGETKS